MDAIIFDHVTKSFRVGHSRSVKDAVLGSAGRRRKANTLLAVNDVTFAIQHGDAVALLGHNGSGKSTALKLLARTIVPASGKVTTNGRVAPLLELGAGFHPDLTGRENIFLNAAVLGVRRSYIREHIDEIIEFSELGDFIDTPVRFYSSGMSARLGFSVAVHVEPEIVLIDEVLAVGDADFQKRCMDRMAILRDEGRTLILVTHSLPQAQSFCTRALVLNHGSLTFDGLISEVDEAYISSTRANVDIQMLSEIERSENK
jgi:ABC-2 type transport system ATP-binding protein